ncbi:MAG: hypothetical protein QOE60_1256, partial [Thermoleophilaceae bacterium]|nr:hypothetical protein [Thermoleophilaceae bacterium]
MEAFEGRTPSAVLRHDAFVYDSDEEF